MFNDIFDPGEGDWHMLGIKMAEFGTVALSSAKYNVSVALKC